MKIRIAIVIALTFCFGCRLHEPCLSTVEVTNKEYERLMTSFCGRFLTRYQVSDTFISTSIWMSKRDTVVGFYGSKKLKPDFLVGHAIINHFKVFFYANSKTSINGLYHVSCWNLTNDSTVDCGDSYSEFYFYKDGFFVPQRHLSPD